MATVARDNIGLLNDKITITVSKEDYFPTFEKKLKEINLLEASELVKKIL